MLGAYRVLDLTEGTGFLCGKLLGDMGADVVKVERPDGDPGRNIGPFRDAIPNPENSLYWLAFNANKRGVTLNIDKAEGQDLLKRLVREFDIVIESFSPGYLEEIGLGYKSLNRINPSIIMASITPFGKRGPYRNYKSSDIVTWAMSGIMYVTGDLDRAPLRVGYPQSSLHAEAEAAVALMIALYHREVTGEGQYIDVSAQQALYRAAQDTRLRWDINRKVLRRAGSRRLRAETGTSIRQVWPCKDGYITYTLFAGKIGGRSNPPLVEWMDSEGMANNDLKEMDWAGLDYTPKNQEAVNMLEEPFARFFMSHTKAELFEEAIKRGIMLYPVTTSKDLVESNQLKYRGFWIDVDYPGLDMRVTSPGAWFVASDTPFEMRRPAPKIGEHNGEVFSQELGFSPEEMDSLVSNRVI